MRKHIAAVISMAVIAVIFNSGCSSKTIEFGHYEQDNDTTNGKEPITWRVIDTSTDGRILIISEKAIDVQPYNDYSATTGITWDKSTIRSWLNGYPASYNTVGNDYTSDNFIDTAFTAEEKARIVETNVPAHPNPDINTPQGDDTTDKVFLLSIPEVKDYLPGEKNYAAEATQYVIKKGAYVYGSESERTTTDRTCADTHCYASWWVRTMGNASNIAAVVYYNGIDHDTKFVKGGVRNYGGGVTAPYSIRPAMWITY